MADPTSSSQVLVVGTGSLGSAVAGVLARQLQVTAWNRTAARANPLRDAGVTVVRDLAAAILQADIIVVCLADAGVVRDVLDVPAVRENLRGRLLVEFTTTSADEARDAAMWAEQAGIAFLAGVVCVYPRHLGTDDAYVLYAGDPDCFTRVASVASGLGGTATHLGTDVRLPSLLGQGDLVFFYGALLGFLQAAAMSEAGGLPIERTLAHIQRGLPLLADVLADAAGRVSEAGYDTSETTVGIDITTLGGFVDTCNDLGLDQTFVASMRAVFERAAAAGHVEHDTASVYEGLRARAKSRQAGASDTRS